MGFRFRRSFKIAPGVRINLGKKGFTSITVGKRGASVSMGKGGTYANTGVPGTGLSYRTKIGGASRGTSSRQKAGADVAHGDGSLRVSDSPTPSGPRLVRSLGICLLLLFAITVALASYQLFLSLCALVVPWWVIVRFWRRPATRTQKHLAGALIGFVCFVAMVSLLTHLENGSKAEKATAPGAAPSTPTLTNGGSDKKSKPSKPVDAAPTPFKSALQAPGRPWHAVGPFLIGMKREDARNAGMKDCELQSRTSGVSSKQDYFICKAGHGSALGEEYESAQIYFEKAPFDRVTQIAISFSYDKRQQALRRLGPWVSFNQSSTKYWSPEGSIIASAIRGSQFVYVEEDAARASAVRKTLAQNSAKESAEVARRQKLVDDFNRD